MKYGIALGKWNHSADNEWARKRVYIKNYIWTPFVKMTRRYTRVELQGQIDNLGKAMLATDRKAVKMQEQIETLQKQQAWIFDEISLLKKIFDGKTAIVGDVYLHGKHNASTIMIIASHLGPNQGFVKIIPMKIENYRQLIGWCKMMAEAYGVDKHNDLYLDIGPGASRRWRRDVGL